MDGDDDARPARAFIVSAMTPPAYEANACDCSMTSPPVMPAIRRKP
ncbi:hypothetical protein I545_0424 [Mycobacterium kansasii 662]|uniref:Uncharacterized protein n=2 Tax=Mycobacterium kansasii TaxID=1768 RepID=A0A1V3XRD7_MYCKA|nr:hypothetical protein I545_0424 [Mycobacterium kansasii 662]OOK81783.1 hypothetical protein BZL30_1485 [Mycobacterium kansasii]OOK83262.1 hypothetical protein BZL29_0466 [Mycobacterium kansasii]